MSDIAIMQANSSVYYLSESMCALDVSNTIRYSNKTPTAPIIGKKIVSELKIPSNVDDKPPPFQIFVKKKKNDQSVAKTSKKKTKTTKIKSCSNEKPYLTKNDLRKSILKKNLVPFIPKPPKSKSVNKRKNFSKENQKENIKENIKENEKSQVQEKITNSNIEAIIKTTLKKEQNNKIKQEKEKKGLEEMREVKKLEIHNQNIQIREENAKVKKIKFKPKYDWGVDQSRLKDPSRSRSRTEKNVYKRPKSSERVRTGLDTIKEIQMELGVIHFRSRSLSQKSEIYEQPSKRSPWQPNPEVKAYMKKQELCRKQKIIYENLHKFAEESRRRAQLQKLEQISKPGLSKKKFKKGKKKNQKKKKKNLQEKEIIQEAPQEDLKSLSLVYDSNRMDSESHSRVDLRLPEKQKIKEQIRSFERSIEKGIDENSMLGFDDEDFSQNSEEQELRNYAATRIQAHIRRFLVQKRLEKQQESFSSVDNQVKNIINRWSQQENVKNKENSGQNNKKNEKKIQKPLIIDIPSSASDRINNIFNSESNREYESEEESKYQSEVTPSSSRYSKDSFKSSRNSPKQVNISSRLSKNSSRISQPSSNLSSRNSSIHDSGLIDSTVQEAQEKKTEYQEKLKEQMIWREAQMHSLEFLRQKEIRDMQIIAQKVGKSDELSDILSNMVEKRYDQLSALFEENLRNVQDVLIQDMNTEERERFEETLEEKREEFSKLIENDSKTMEEYIEDIMSRNNLNDSDSSENRPAIYKPKSGLSIQSFEDPDLSKVNPESNFVSPTQKDFTIQESTIKKVDSDEEGFSLFQIAASPKSSNSSSVEMQKIQILTPSPEKSTRKKKIKPETPPSNSPRERKDVLQNTEEVSLDVSNSITIQDSSLFEQLQGEFPSGPSRTPDYIPDRPSAPLQYFESGRDSPYVNTSPGLPSSSENDVMAEENSDIEWVSNIENQVSAEFNEKSLLKNIFDEHSSQKRELPEIPIVNIHEMEHEQENSTDSEPRIQTDAVSVKNYIEEIFENCDLAEIEQNLKVPIKKKPLELLNRMQEVEIGSIIDSEYCPAPEVLSVNIYLTLENNRENVENNVESSTRPSNSPHIQQLIIEAEHIHNKMIFDAVNECLQKFRPYGLSGVPMPWSFSNRSFGKGKPIKEIIEKIKDEVIDWSTIQAGKICTEDMLLSNGVLDEELLQQVREERLGSMLAEEVIDNDDVWTNYEFEEAQVKLDLADMILETLAGEIINLLG